jgi:hypothetical protein
MAIDNSNLGAKLALRRFTLRETAWPDLDVLDLCAGAGHIWSALRSGQDRLPVRHYLPCDRSPRTSLAGTIRGEAVELAASLDLSRFNVIDMDTYGEPWPILIAAVERIARETMIFVTRGRGGQSMASMSNCAKRVAGIPTEWPIPLSAELHAYVDRRILSALWNSVDIVSTRSVLRYPPRANNNGGAVQYLAIRVKPISAAPRRRSSARARPPAASRP